MGWTLLNFPTQLPWPEDGNQNSCDSISSGSWCCGQLFCSVGFGVCVCVQCRNHRSLTYTSTLTYINPFLWMSSCVPCKFVRRPLFSACTSTSMWSDSLSESTSQGSCLTSIVPLFIHPPIWPCICPCVLTCVWCATVMSCFGREELPTAAIRLGNSKTL